LFTGILIRTLLSKLAKFKEKESSKNGGKIREKNGKTIILVWQKYGDQRKSKSHYRHH
jgi:predicted restriction endonuclease